MFWEIILNGKVLNSVWYDKDSDADYVKFSLVNHSGYDPNITVRPE